MKFRHRARRFFRLLLQVFDSEVVANEYNSSEFCLSRKKAHLRERPVPPQVALEVLNVLFSEGEW